MLKTHPEELNGHGANENMIIKTEVIINPNTPSNPMSSIEIIGYLINNRCWYVSRNPFVTSPRTKRTYPKNQLF